MTERRYNDEELAAIFRIATEEGDPGAQSGAPPGLLSGEAHGFTLIELQDIGADAGISPEAVARAATALDAGANPGGSVGLSVPAAPGKTLLGIPMGVSRTAPLARPLSDGEWGRLVAVLRETFDARGQVEEAAGVRQWSNGNLVVALEPWQDTERLRMRTRKGNALQLAAVGGAVTGFGLLSGLMGVLGLETAGEALRIMLTLGVPGLALLGGVAVNLLGWSRTRERQFQGLAEQVQRLAEAPEE